jgi:Mn-dependent DtxR family transcriptional regulator
MTAQPITDVSVDHLNRVVDQKGTIRLTELADDLEVDVPTLHGPLMELAKRGDVAIFPVGDSVQVRSE